MLKSTSVGNPRAHQNELRDATVRKFDGGWNVVDNDLNMDTRFAKVLDNFERDPDGNLSLRPGTRLFAKITDDLTNILNCIYFDNQVVTVQYSGLIHFVSSTGIVTLAPLVSGTAFWPLGTNYANFNTFASQLIIHNGVNKPLVITGDPISPNYRQVSYLVDPASGSNINTPVGLFGCTHGQYHVIAGSPAKPSSIFVSARGAPGTFVGDPAPNDAIEVDLGSRVALGNSKITGLLSHRDRLIVCFEQGVIPMTLGVYTGSPSVHAPTDDGFLQNFGCISHRSLISIGEEALYADPLGIVGLRRSTFNTTNLKPERASYLVDPETTKTITPLVGTSNAQLVNAVYDLRNKRYMLFVPTYNTTTGALIESICYSYTYIPNLRVSAWARLRGWKWTCACRTSLQKIIFGGANKLYTYDFDSNNNADFFNDPEVSDSTGTAVTGTWELPWADLNNRRKKKHSKFIALETEGTATFNLKMYVDRILVDGTGTDAPLLSMDFVGGSAGGYGTAPYATDPYGSGRLTADERLVGWEGEFNLMKLKFTVSTKLKLKFISTSMLYQLGTYRR